jgi:hypothetical protein
MTIVKHVSWMASVSNAELKLTTVMLTVTVCAISLCNENSPWANRALEVIAR